MITSGCKETKQFGQTNGRDDNSINQWEMLVAFYMAFEVQGILKSFKLHYPKELVIIYMLFQQWWGIHWRAVFRVNDLFCSRRRHTCTLTPPPLNSCHCCVNGEIWYNALAKTRHKCGYPKKDWCKNEPYPICSRMTLSIKMLLAYLSHLHLTQLASQMPELPIQGFSLRKNQRSSKWIQSNFPTSCLSKHWNTCMDFCHELKKWLWMFAKVFSTAINTGLLLQSLACQCVCALYVCVPKPCQLEGHNRGEERSDEIRGDDNSALI